MITTNDCVVCGATMSSTRNDKKTCSSTCRNKLRIITRDQDNAILRSTNGALLGASSELDQLKHENERLNKQNEELKESIRKYHRRVEQLEEIIERRDDTIIKQKGEIERLKLERRVYEQKKTKRHQGFAREHLERVLHSEIRRQFPNNPTIQEHIGPIRSFTASYINALVTA